MSPKEKAKELVDRMLGVQVDAQTFHMYNTLETAKYSALIAVDEMIAELTKEISPSIHGFRHNYWQEVKNEIELL